MAKWQVWTPASGEGRFEWLDRAGNVLFHLSTRIAAGDGAPVVVMNAHTGYWGREELVDLPTCHSSPSRVYRFVVELTDSGFQVLVGLVGVNRHSV